MAALGLLFWLLLLGPPRRVPGQPDPSLSRRFSGDKLCADEECSMLMYRGEALEDFTGPDCRFVSFKKGDPVYVYYKLAGKSPEVWAGSVGRNFGYFPKDLIHVVNEYTKEELQLPTDETDFVCFDGGKDNFDNYNLEELLGPWRMYNSVTGDFERILEKDSQHMKKLPEENNESDHKSEPKESNLNENESFFSENNKHQEEKIDIQKNHLHANSQTVNAEGDQSSLDSFEEQEELKVLESENNKTIIGSQASNLQETIDAYNLLRKEMTLDLKTKFGSTSDAVVSDDETTRLVTSLEDDMDEEMDVEYYTVGKEEKESKENFNEVPLLTFADEEDVKTLEKSEAEKYPTVKEQKLNEEDINEIAQSPGIEEDDKNILRPLQDSTFSVFTGSEEKTEMVDLESSNSDEEKDDVLIPEGQREEEKQSAGHSIDPENAEGDILIIEVPKTDDGRNFKIQTELDSKGKDSIDEESVRGLLQDETEPDVKKQEEMHDTTYNNNLKSLLAAEKGKEPLISAFDNKENGQKEVAIHVSKGMLREEKPDEHIIEHSSDSEATHGTAGNQMNEGKMKRESRAIAPLPGDNAHTAGRDSGEEVEILESRPESHSLLEEHGSEGFKAKLILKTPNQPSFSSHDEDGLPTELEVPIQGRNLSWQQEQDVSAAVNEHLNEKIRLTEDTVQEDTSVKKIFHYEAVQGTQEVAKTGQIGKPEVPAFQTENPEAEDDDYSLKELLEDENALSAKQSKEKDIAIQDRLDINLQTPKRVIFETTNPDLETSEDKTERSVLWEMERKTETVATETERRYRDPASMEVEKEKIPSVDKKIHRPFEVGDFADTQNFQPLELGEGFQNKDSNYFKDDHPAEHLKTSGPTENPEVGEFSKEDDEYLQKFMDPEVQWSASEKLEIGLDHAPSQTAVKPEYIDKKDLAIIRSFFKEQQSLQRFQKYFDVHQLENMFQDLSLKLKSAQQESLPYNVDKVLDKVFRASESHILTVAEKMLNSRVIENKNLGMNENNIFEEAAVLDDVQDLIYFVRYRHLTAEETRPVAVAQPPEESWDEPTKEMQLPDEDHFPPGIQDFKMQIPEEPGHLDQHVTNNTDALEVSQMSTTEKDLDTVLGITTTESTFVDTKNQPDTDAEGTASATPFGNAALLVYSFMHYFIKKLVATLPDDVQPGPDFYGLPWKPVLTTAFLGIISFAIFLWRTVLAVKPRIYQVSEQQIAEKIKNIMKENAELVEKLSNYEQKIKDSKKHIQESMKQNRILSDEAITFENKIKELEETNNFLDGKAKSLRAMLESEKEQNVKNEELILENKKIIEKLKDVISVNASEFSEVQIAFNEAKLNEEKVKHECLRLQEENTKLKKKEEQLQLEIEDWHKSHVELSEQINSFQKFQKDLEMALTRKDDNIDALANCISQLNRLDYEGEEKSKGGGGSDELANGEIEGDQSERMKTQIKQMMDVTRTKTAMSLVEEDLKLLQFKLSASLSTKCDLEDQIKNLEDDYTSLLSTKAELEKECKTLKQKVEILNELYQEKEMALQKKLSQEECERQAKEQRLSATDEKAILAAEELKSYKRRIEEMEDELQKRECSFKNQIAAQEKKAHENWLKARAAERAIAEEKREAANLRHKLLEITQKMARLQEDPVIVKPMPGRPNTQNPPQRGSLSQNGSFDPSPVSGGECSPPLTIEPPVRRHSTIFSGREMPRSEFGPLDGPLPHSQWPSEAAGKPSASDQGSMMNNSSRSSSPKVMDEGKVNIAAKEPPPFTGIPLMSSPMGGPPPIRYGPPPPRYGPFGPRPLPPPFGPALRLPLSLREYAPGIPPGKRDVPLNPQEFTPGHPPFRSFGPREYFISGTRLPPPPHGPQHYPSSAARDLIPTGSSDEPPSVSQNSSQDSSQALNQSP